MVKRYLVQYSEQTYQDYHHDQLKPTGHHGHLWQACVFQNFQKDRTWNYERARLPIQDTTRQEDDALTETEVKLKLFEDYERIHGLVFSKEHKQKMMDELDLYSFISKINEYMYFAKESTQIFSTHC